MRKPKKPKSQLSVAEIKDEIFKLREEGLKIVSHFNELIKYYEDYEDRCNKIEAKIQELESETGLTSDQILEPTAEDLFDV